MSLTSLQFIRHEGTVAPLDKANVDTDQIIPKQFLKSIKKTGFGKNLFDAWRFNDKGDIGKPESERKPNPGFVLNDVRYTHATVLLARENFACGSSREHAVWALMQYGFRAVIAPSFADIFYNNSFNNGLLPIQLSSAEVTVLFEEATQDKALSLVVDLPSQSVTTETDSHFQFEIEPQRKTRMLKGLDEIGLSLEYASQIREFETKHRARVPWVFAQD